MKIQFTTPTADSPGFLKRTRTAAILMEELKGGKFSAKSVDDLVDFLVVFVTEPAEPKEAREALLDVSQNDFTNMLTAIMGGGATVPPATVTTSNVSTSLVLDESPTGSLS